MRKILTFLSIAAVFCLSSCKEKQIPGGPARLDVDKEAISATSAGGTEIVLISSNCYWDIALTGTDGKPVTWVTLSEKSGQADCMLGVNIAANIKTEARSAIMTISTPASSELTKVVTITQEKGEKPVITGYSFPVCQTIDIDSPETRNFSNGVISGNICLFNAGMSLTWNQTDSLVYFYCPSHTEPTDAKGGSAEARSIHRSIYFQGFAKGDSLTIEIPLKEALWGDLRLMLGARAASFTGTGWSYFWSNDKESWYKLPIEKAKTPGSDAVWNVIDFNVPEINKVPAGGSLYFMFVSTADRSKTFLCISNTIYLGRPTAKKSDLPPMDDETVAFTHGFDDLVGSLAADVALPIGWLRSATNSYATNYTSFNNEYAVPAEYKDIAATKGCYEKPGYLQVGYYDESLWTRQCIGKYTIKIGERLKAMGVSSADAKLSLKLACYKDFRGYDPLAKVYAQCASDSISLNMTIGEIVDNEVEFKNLNQSSEILITCPRLSDAEVAALGRGTNAKNLVDYRFYIDDLKVILTEIHAKGASTNGSYDDFNNGGQYNW